MVTGEEKNRKEKTKRNKEKKRNFVRAWCVRTDSLMTSGCDSFGAKDVQTSDDVTVIQYVRLTFLCVLLSEKL